MTEQETMATTPVMFTTPSDRPMLDREILASLHEASGPLDVEAIQQDLNSERSRPHVAQGPLETLIKELVKAGKIQELVHGSPARPHFILANEVRVNLDGSWQRAKALAAVVVALGEPGNKSTIRGLSDTIGRAILRAEDALPLPTSYLSAVFALVDTTSPEAVDAWVTIQLDTLMRNGQVMMTAIGAADVQSLVDTLTADDNIETTTVDDAAPVVADGSGDAAPVEVPDGGDAETKAESELETSTEPTEPNLHNNEFSLYPSAWERLVTDGALAVAIEGVPELVQQKRDASDATRELRVELEKVKKDADLNKALAEQRRLDLSTENDRLRTNAAKFTAFCEENGIDFALVVSGPKKECLRETHVISGTLTFEVLATIIGERDKAKRYHALREEQVKDATTRGKTDVKEALARVEALDNVISIAGNSGIGAEFQYEKQCVKSLQNGHLVWKSDEPHDLGRIVDTQPLTIHEAKEKEKGKKEKPLQIVVPGTAKNAQEVEWTPGNKLTDGASTTTEPTDNAAATTAIPEEKKGEGGEEPSDAPADSADVDSDDDSDDADDDADADVEVENDSDDVDADADEDESAAPEAAGDAPAYTPPKLNSVNQSTAKTFVYDYVNAMGRSTTRTIGVAYATACNSPDKARVIEFGEKIAEQLVADGRFDSEKVGSSVFVWVKADVLVAADPTPAPAKAKRTRKPKATASE